MSASCVYATSVLSAGCPWKLSCNSFLQSTSSLCLLSNWKDLQFSYLLPCHLQQTPEAQQSTDHHWCKVFNLMIFVHFLCVWDVGIASTWKAFLCRQSSYYAIGSVLREIERKYGLSGCLILLISSTIVYMSQKHQQEQYVFTSAAVKPNTRPVCLRKILPTAQISIRVDNWKTGASTSNVFQ